MAITRLGRLLRQQDQGGLSQSLLSALAATEARGPMTLGELAAYEQVAPPTVTKLVERLEGLGYVTRAQDPSDRRVHRISPTAAGRAQLEINRTLRTAWLAERLAALPADELVDVEAVLHVLEHLTAPPTRSDGPSA
jgi:DNA-binding MarR family transcriptional regulator